MVAISTLLIDLKVQDYASKGIADLTRELKTLDKEISAVKSSADQYESKQKSLQSVHELQENKVKALVQQKKLYGEELTKLKTKLETAKQKQEEMAGDTEQYGEQVAKTDREVKSLTSQIERKEQALRRADAELVTVNADLKQTQKALSEVDFREFADKMENTSKITGNLANAFAPLSLAAGGALAFSTKKAVDFEAQMSKVASVSTASAEEIAQITAKAKEMGETTPKTAKEAGEAFEYMALAGFSVEEMLNSVEPIMKLSVATNLDLARTSDLVTDAMSSLGVKSQDLGHMLDIVSTTQANANTTAEDMLEAYIKAGGTFRNLKVPLEESAYWVGVLANQGYKAEQAGTSLNSIMINLTSGTGKAGKEMEKLGISAFDTEGNFKGMTVVLGEVAKALEGATEEQINNTLANLGGKTQIAAMQKLMAGLGDEYNDLRIALQDTNGALDTQYEIMRDNVKGQFEEVSSKVEGLALKLGEILLPMLSNFLDSIGGLVDKFSGLDEGLQKGIVGALLFTAGLAPVLKVVSSVTGSIGGLTKFFLDMNGSLVGGAVTGGGGGLLSSVASFGPKLLTMLGPIGLTVAGIGGLSWVIIKLIEHFGQTSESTDTVITSLDTVTEAMTNFTTEPVTNALQEVIDKNQELLNSTKETEEQIKNERVNAQNDYIATLTQFNADAISLVALLGDETLNANGTLSEELKTLVGTRNGDVYTLMKEESDKEIALLEERVSITTGIEQEEAKVMLQNAKDKWYEYSRELNLAGQNIVSLVNNREAAIQQIALDSNVSLIDAEKIFNSDLTNMFQEFTQAELRLQEQYTGEFALNSKVANERVNADVKTALEEKQKTLNKSYDDERVAIVKKYQDEALLLKDDLNSNNQLIRENAEFKYKNLEKAMADELELVDKGQKDNKTILDGMAEDFEGTSERITGALNEDEGHKNFQKYMNADKDAVYAFRDSANAINGRVFTATVRVKYEETGTSSAIQAGKKQGYSLPTPYAMPSLGIEPMSNISMLSDGDISNVATANEFATSTINNIMNGSSAKTKSSSPDSDIATLLRQLLTNESQQQTPTNININIENMSATSDSDIRALAEKIDKELQIRSARNKIVRGSANYVY